MRKNLGFSLIELLVVIAIIGLLASVIVVSLGNARQKARDGARLSDMHQIKTGMDIYYNTGGGYPDTATFNSDQSSGTELACSGTDAMKIPQDPLNIGDPTFVYTYTAGGNTTDGCGGTVYSDYKVQFKTEGNTEFGAAGTYWLSGSKGITSSAPF